MRLLVVLAILVAPHLSAQHPARSSDWLGRLPDGEGKRRFILDCTGCHQFDSVVVLPEGRPRTEAEWVEAVERMLGFAGATSAFPVISSARDPAATARYLVQTLGEGSPAGSIHPEPRAQITEYEMPMPGDLPHDLAVDSSGQVIITGMFSHRMYRLNPSIGTMAEVQIPVAQANPRAVELGPGGDWFVLLGGPRQLARYSIGSRRWSAWPLAMYPHSLAIGHDGRIWFNGHFTRDPELIGSILPSTGRGETAVVPQHPSLGTVPGGPIPYELRLAPDGSVWGSELAGNRIFSYQPGGRRFSTWTLPTPVSGPRRFDIDQRGVLWIPAYAAGLLVKFEPATGRFTEIALPVADALPYVVRVDHGRDVLWIGTAAADVVLRFDIRTNHFTVFPLPSRGALIRHLAVDPRSHDVWLAYGASPGRIAARVARLRERP